MNWQPPTRCELCGTTERRDLEVRLVHWAKAEPGMAYAHIGACRDRVACRARCEAAGDKWPLFDESRRRAS